MNIQKKDHPNNMSPGNNIDLSGLSDAELQKIKEFEGRIEAMAKSTSEDFSLIMIPGIRWSMNVEHGILTYPLYDLLSKGIDTTLGYALHEGGHRDITRIVDRFWHGRETLRALFNVVEDPRVNTYEESKWPGSSFYLSKTYDAEWPRIEHVKENQYYDDIRVLPHLQLLNSIIYYYRYGVIDPRIRNENVLEVFHKTIKFIKDSYSKHPPIFHPSEEKKRDAQRQMSEIIKGNVLPEYERLIKDSAIIVEDGLINGKIQLAPETGMLRVGFGGLSVDELSQQARDYIERQSKKLADELEAKIARADSDQIKKEITREKKLQELNRSRKGQDGGRIRSLKDIAENKIANDRLREAQKTEWDNYLSPVASLVTTLIGLLENELTKDERPKYRGYYRSGKKTDLRKYFQYQASGYDPAYEKFWMKKSLPTKPSINFSLILDESGSMAEGERDLNALKSLTLFVEVLNHFDIDFNIIGFSDTPSIHKEFNEDITTTNKDSFIRRVAGYIGTGGTDDTAAVEMAVGTIVKESEADHKVVIVISDGEGNMGKSEGSGIDRDGRYYNLALNDVLHKADLNGIDVIGVGIGEGIKYVSDLYGKSIVESKIDHLPEAFANLMIEKILEEGFVHSNVNR